jgi:hypothetical protein
VCVCSLIAVSSCSANLPSKAEFLKFMQTTNVASAIFVEASSPDKLDEIHFHSVLIGMCIFYYEEADKEIAYDDFIDSNYFTREDFRSVSQDFLGFMYPYAGAEKALVDTTSRFSFNFSKPEDVGFSTAYLDEASLVQHNNQLQIEADIVLDNGTVSEKLRMRYLFEYMPNNKYIPYRFVSSVVIK